MIKVDELWEKRYAKVFCWTLYDEEINNEFFLHHLKRVLDSDLSYPIILSEEDYILDGVHRLMKCKYLNIKYINYVKFKKDPPILKKKGQK
jgi:disulfide oxidoreductase YuzD